MKIYKHIIFRAGVGSCMSFFAALLTSPAWSAPTVTKLPWSSDIKSVVRNEKGDQVQGPKFFRVDSLGNFYVAQAQTRKVAIVDPKTTQLSFIEPTILVESNVNSDMWLTVDPWAEGAIFYSKDRKKMELVKKGGGRQTVDISAFCRADVRLRNGNLIDQTNKKNLKRLYPVAAKKKALSDIASRNAVFKVRWRWRFPQPNPDYIKIWSMTALSGFGLPCKNLEFRSPGIMNALEYIGEGDGKLYYSLWGWEDDRPTSELWLIQSNIESCKVLTAKVPRDIVAQMVIDIQVSVDGDISLMTATGEGLNFYTWQADVDF